MLNNYKSLSTTFSAYIKLIIKKKNVKAKVTLCQNAARKIENFFQETEERLVLRVEILPHFIFRKTWYKRLRVSSNYLGEKFIHCIRIKTQPLPKEKRWFVLSDPACWPERWKLPRQGIDVCTASNLRSSSRSTSRTCKETERRRCGRSHSNAQVSDSITKY